MNFDWVTCGEMLWVSLSTEGKYPVARSLGTVVTGLSTWQRLHIDFTGIERLSAYNLFEVAKCVNHAHTIHRNTYAHGVSQTMAELLQISRIAPQLSPLPDAVDGQQPAPHPAALLQDESGEVTLHDAALLSTLHDAAVQDTDFPLATPAAGASASTPNQSIRWRTDPLLSVSSADALVEELRHRAEEAFLQKQPLCLLAVESDGDDEQHNDGLDRDIAGVVQSKIRKGDRVARLGASRFAVLLGDTTLFEACRIAERVRLAAKRTSQGYRAPRISFSIGIAVCCPSSTEDQYIEQAVTAMQRAKAAGGNQVVVDQVSVRQLIA